MWNVAAAKQDLTAVIRAAQTEPQVIANRGRPVAAVIPMAALAELERGRTKPAATLASLLLPLREAMIEANVALPTVARTDRLNPFIEATGVDPK